MITLPPSSTRSNSYYERLLEVVFENATLALIVMDEQQRCASMNAAAERLTGYTLVEAVGRIMHEMIHHTRPDGSFYPLAECPINRAFPQNSREQGEELFIHKDGHFYQVAFTASPIRAGDDILGTVIELRDITEEQRATRERLLAETRLRRLQQATSSLVETRTLAEVRRVILGDVLNALEADGGALRRVVAQGLIIDESDLGTRMNEDDLRRYGYLPLTMRHPATDALRSGEAVFIVDAAELMQRYSELAPTVVRQKTEASAHLPLKRGEEVFGVLSMSFATPQSWDTAERDFALTLARRTAVSYERARLFEAEQRARKRSERLQALTARLATALAPADVVAAVLEEGLPVLGSNAGSVVQLDGDDVVIIGSTGYPAELTQHWQRFPLSASTPLGEAIRTEKGVWLESSVEFGQRFSRLPDTVTLTMSQSWVALPLLADGHLVGALAISYSEPQVFDPDSRRFAETLADLCAQALERSRLFAAERAACQRVEETSSLLGQALGAAGMVAWNVVNSQLTTSRNTAAVLGADVAGARTPQQGIANIHPDDLEPKLKAFGQATERGTDYHAVYRFLNRDRNEWLWLEDHGRIRYENGIPIGMNGVTQDITERKRRELNAVLLTRVSKDLLSLSNVDQIMHVMAREIGEFFDVSHCVFAEFDLAANTAVVHHDWRKNPNDQDFAATYQLSAFVTDVFRQTLHAGKSVIVDDVTIDPRTADSIDNYRKLKTGAFLNTPHLSSGELRASLVVHQPTAYHWRDDEIELLRELTARIWMRLERVRAEEVLRDVQARRLAEAQQHAEREQVARAQAEEASRLKDDFLATVSHELRTPLTALLGYAQLLQMRRRDEAYVARTVEKMVRSAKVQAQLVEDLLDISRIVSGKLRIEPQPIDLIGVVQAALDTVRPALETKNLQLQLDLNPEASAITGDANRLQQVVWNLLSNAVKFTPAGGVIHVRLQFDNRDAQLSISDTGPGISAAFLPYVFDRFRQADSASNRAYNGLGLGLAIVRHLVELHGGTVQAASAGENQGATFTVRLPLTTNRPVPTLADDAFSSDVMEYPPELRGLRVLLVDDQPDILELLHEILVPCGVIVQLCNTAQQALNVLRDWQPDVLVSDIAMPGEDGYWLIRHVRELAPAQGGTIPAIALTAYVRMEERLRVLAAGFQRYVPKPVEPDELLAVVASLAQAGEDVV